VKQTIATATVRPVIDVGVMAENHTGSSASLIVEDAAIKAVLAS
jgi:hypothetical protein